MIVLKLFQYNPYNKYLNNCNSQASKLINIVDKFEKNSFLKDAVKVCKFKLNGLEN